VFDANIGTTGALMRAFPTFLAVFTNLIVTDGNLARRAALAALLIGGTTCLGTY